MQRRKFLQQTLQNGAVLSTVLAAGTLPLIPHRLFADSAGQVLRIGLVTDIHYADKEQRGSRYYRDSLAKLQIAKKEWQKQNIAFLVSLGDAIDSVNTPDGDLKSLRSVNEVLRQVCDARYYVLGNHCVECLTKKEYLEGVGQKKSYFSFDKGGYHFVILDADFRPEDGKAYGRNNSQWNKAVVPEAELIWMQNDLSSTTLPVIVFLHQRLDGELTNGHVVKNCVQVRRVLEKSGKVQLVFQGHQHSGGYNEISGIKYLTLKALIEEPAGDAKGQTINNAFSVLEIAGKNFKLYGYYHQKNWEGNVSGGV
jgi:alkaline phosphatase